MDGGISARSGGRRFVKLLLDAVIVLVVVAIAVIGFRYFTRQPEAPTMDFIQRMAVVLEFVNRTGEAQLDSLGMQMAEELTEGLLGTGYVVVPSVESLPPSDGKLVRADAVSELAARKSAGIVISGEFRREDAGLRIICDVTDSATGSAAYSIEMLSDSTEPGEALQEIRERVTGLMAMSFANLNGVLGKAEPHERLWTLTEPPRYSAFTSATTSLRKIRSRSIAAGDTFVSSTSK